MSSMGSILADLTSAIIRARKKKSKKWNKNKKQGRKGVEQQTEIDCQSCYQKTEQLVQLEQNLTNHKLEREKLGQVLQTQSDEEMMEVLEKMVADSTVLRANTMQLEEDEKTVFDNMELQLKARDDAHSERIKSLEMLMAEKKKQLLESSNTLRGQLGTVLKEKQQLTKQLTQIEANGGNRPPEVEILQQEIDMKREEVNQLKAANNSLRLDMERHEMLEVQLQVEKQRSEEMTAVIGLKNDQLRQVLDQYDDIQHQLDIEIAAHLACQQELEKKQYEKDNFLNNSINVSSVIGSKNWKNLANQKESCLILDVVQKEKGVAYSFNY